MSNGELRRLSKGALGIVAALAVLPGSAVAAPSPTPGVQVDPNSPVAKEYSIPLSNARGGTPGSAQTGPTFGSGITRGGGGGSAGGGAGSGAASTSTGASAGSTGSTSAAKHSVARHKGAHHRSHATAPVKPVVQRHPASIEAPPSAAKVIHAGSGSGFAWMAGVGVLVLVLGGLGGYALTARTRRNSPHPG